MSSKDDRHLGAGEDVRSGTADEEKIVSLNTSDSARQTTLLSNNRYSEQAR